jgi:hypothetical protein
VVPGRGYDDSSFLLLLGKPRNQVDASTDLERTNRLAVLMFDVHLGPYQFIDLGIAEQGRRFQIRSDALLSS